MRASLIPTWLQEWEKESGYWNNKEAKMQTKKWFYSRQIWIDILAVVGSIIAGICTKNWLDGETQVMILAIIDFVLRLRTNQGLTK